MTYQPQIRPIPSLLLAGLTIASIAAGSLAISSGWHFSSSQSPTLSSQVQQLWRNGTQNKAQLPTEKTVQIYWLKDEGDRIKLAQQPIELQSGDQSTVVLESALKHLLKGTKNPSLISTLPQTTQLRSITIQGNKIDVDLSQEFTSGGGSASMTGRVAQILYTSTTLEPNAQVWLSVEGKPLEVLGGEGLMLDRPLTRQNFEANFEL